MPTYRIFDLHVESDVELPGLIPAAGAPSLEIRLEAVPADLPEGSGGGALFHAGPGEALIHIPPVGRFHIAGGRRISVEPAAGVNHAHLPVFLMNLCLGVLLQQRGDLVLHASVVEVEGGCIALGGASASGKSWLAARFRAQGHRILSDELCVVRPHEKGGMQVHPGPPYLQLWRDALEAMGTDPGGLTPVRPDLEKYLFPLGDRWCPDPLPLRRLYRLVPWNGEDWEFQRLSGGKRFEAHSQVAFRREYLAPMGLAGPHFRQLAGLAQTVGGGRLQRPNRPTASSHEGVEILLRELAGGEEGA